MTDAPAKPRDSRGDALAVVRRLRDAGHIAYFAGGCVRDALLGLEPKDYDVATDAPPDRVRELFPRTQAVGAAFGVILVRQGRSQIEVATFRADLKYVDGRRPEGVVFTTAEEDAKRRDFTINGMFFDPVADKVIDYVGGQEDLQHKRLRAIGKADERFAEDHLRMLRAVRFAARFGLRIETGTASAVAAQADQLKRISPERVADELRRMLTAESRHEAWRLLWTLGLMPVIFRQLPEHPEWPPRNQRVQIFPLLAMGESVSFGLALAALVLCYRMNSREEPQLSFLLTREEVHRAVQACRTLLKVSNAEAESMAGALGVAALLLPDPPSVAAMKRFLALPTSPDARRLLDAICRFEGRPYPGIAARQQWLEEQFAKLAAAGEIAPPPLITGDDLKAAGLAPGPAFKRALDEAYDAQLEGRVTTKEQALELALRAARNGA